MSLSRIARLAVVLAALSVWPLAGSSSSGSGASRRQGAAEMRAMWVVRDSLASPRAVQHIVDTAERYGFNALFVQARGRGDAWYRSELEPRAEGLSRQPSTYDPLALVIEEAHRRGIQVHAWLNTYLTWSGSRLPRDAGHIVNAHPDWIARDRNGRFTMKGTDSVEGMFVQPSNPAVQEHLYRVFTDVARRYAVDGIHFDYVRYPGSDYDFADATLARFATYMAPRMRDIGRDAVRKDGTRMAYVHCFPVEWAEWRRAQVSGLVKRIADAVHGMRPNLAVSAAVFPDADDAYRGRGQDWRGWLAAGYLDAACPMAYSRSTETVSRQIRSALDAAVGRSIYAGLGAWRLTAASTAEKIAQVRALGAHGFCLFSYDGITADGTSNRYLDYLARTCLRAAARTAAAGSRAGSTP